MTLDRGVKLFILIAMPVYAMLFFILIFDNYTHDTEGKMNQINSRRGTGQFPLFPKSPPSDSSAFYTKKRIHPSPLTRKLAAFRGNPDSVEEAEEEQLDYQKLDKHSDVFDEIAEDYQEVSKRKQLRHSAHVHATSLFTMDVPNREMKADAFTMKEITKPVTQMKKKGSGKNYLLRNKFAASVRSLKDEQKHESYEVSVPGDSDYDGDSYYDSDGNEDNDDYNEPFDHYKYENYDKHNLFTDLFKPGYLIENRGLCRRNTQVFIFINSRANQTDTRIAIRQTYLRRLVLHGSVSYAFVISKPKNGNDLKVLERENEIYGDLILIAVEESYTNLTLKTGHILHWSKKNCPSAAYVAKIDDDVYVNVPEFLKVLETERNFTILGKVCSNCAPFTGKPYSLKEALRLFSNVVTPRHMPLVQFPPFAMGPAYIMTNDVTGWLLEGAQLLPYFSYEDVFWTSLVVEVVNEESGITFESPDVIKQVNRKDEEREEEQESIKYKYLTMKEEKSPSINIARVDIPNWRLERTDTLETALHDSLSSVTIHGIRWQEDKSLIETLENAIKERPVESSSPSVGLDSSKVQTWERLLDRELIEHNSAR